MYHCGMYSDDRLSGQLSSWLDDLQMVSGWGCSHSIGGAMEITKEEFGSELYDAIACCSGVQQVLRIIAAGVEKNKDVSHLATRYKVEKEKAKVLAQSEAISADTAARLARQYPWLLT